MRCPAPPPLFPAPSPWWTQALDSLDDFDPPSLTAVVGTVPGSSGVVVPEKLLARLKPVVLDAAYVPRMTPLLTAAAAAGCRLAFGAEMLFEQAVEAFEIWTGRTAPRKEMAQAIVAKLPEPEVPVPPILRKAIDGAD